MKRRFRKYRELEKREYVSEVLAGFRTEVVARKYGMHPGTLRRWVKEYEDEVDEMVAKRRSAEERMKEAAEKLPELEKKYEKAMKLLGEKELEIEILRELVKKKHPDWRPPSSGSKKVIQ